LKKQLSLDNTGQIDRIIKKGTKLCM